MSIPIQTTFGSFSAKRLTLRMLKEAVALVEEIQKSQKHSTTIELIERVLAMTFEGESLIDQVDLQEAMELIGLAISGGKVSDTERKKSE